MSEWQPIETAPRDEDVLGWTPNGVSIVYWTDGSPPVPDDPGMDAGWLSNGGETCPGCPGYNTEAQCQPTHWMPLPDPPTLPLHGEMMDIELVATMFRRCAYNAYSNTLVGGSQASLAAFKRMKAPQVGDWIIEASTIGGMRHANATDLDGIGVLEEIAEEKVVFAGDPDFVWNEEEEGRPHPTERIYYIRTIDGRRFRWNNATIIAVPTSLHGEDER